MKKDFIGPLVTGILLMAIAASAKAIVDVSVLKGKFTTFKELLYEVRNDVKYIRGHLKK